MKNIPFHAVIVKCTEHSCGNAKRYEGKKVLTTEFERQVLRHCHNTDCPCEFEQFDDRRVNASKNSSGTHYGRRVTDKEDKR